MLMLHCFHKSTKGVWKKNHFLFPKLVLFVLWTWRRPVSRQHDFNSMNIGLFCSVSHIHHSQRMGLLTALLLLFLRQTALGSLRGQDELMLFIDWPLKSPL